jgi:transcriptional regulator nrdR
MKCMYCGCLDSRVLDSRPTEEGSVIRRRRECPECGKRFTTYEKIETSPVMVVKKDGSRQLFEINKVRLGIVKACEKCKVSAEQIEHVVNEIDRQVHSSLEHEVSTTEIGEMIMDKLMQLDQVAYVRFASVYREFKDIDSFMKELSSLLKANEQN